MCKFFSRLSALVLCVASLHASEMPGNDPDLPQPFDYRALQSVVTQSPFSRTVSFDQTYQLTGIAYVEGKPVATVLNKETKQRFLISEEPNAQGWQLLSASAVTEPGKGQTEIQVGEEIVTLHMNGMSQPTEANGKKHSAKAMLAAGDKKHDGDKMRPSNYLGENGREMYASLSSEGRDKFKDLLKSRLTKHPELSNEQTSDYAQKVFAKLKASDSSMGGPSPKPSKPSKKKQGV